ncbi:hypothetical protein EB809_16090 [Marinobacter sp. R17]|nr:hypothetical protein EB809_16090 [Marinobacter sp. R17]
MEAALFRLPEKLQAQFGLTVTIDILTNRAGADGPLIVEVRVDLTKIKAKLKRSLLWIQRRQGLQVTRFDTESRTESCIVDIVI